MATRKFLYFNAEGFSQEQGSTDDVSLGKVTASGVGGVAFDASSQRIAQVAAPTTGSDAANKTYVDQVAAGISFKNAVRLATAAALPACTAAGSGAGKTLTANANGALSVDSVAVAVGNRVLVKNQATGADNGVYDVTAAGGAGAPYVLTRSTDFDGSGATGEVRGGAAVFVAEGSTLADTGWTLTTDDPITVDTTSLTFVQFTGGTTGTAGQGLSKTVNTFAVELDTGADAQSAGSDGGNSGLEFDATGDNGKLRVRVDAAGGIQRTSSGLALEIDDTPDTLDVGGAGLKVVGLPSQFKVNGTQVGASVTAANLDTLVGGVSSAADALHEHNRVGGLFTADEAIAAFDPVAWSTATNGRVVKGRADTSAKARIVAVARTAAGSAGSTFQAISQGVLAGALSGASVGVPYYVDTAGGLTATKPSASGSRVIRVGLAMNATDLWVHILDYGQVA